MFKVIILFLAIVWVFRRYWQRRTKIQCCEQFKNDIQSMPIIGHVYLLHGNDEKKMRALETFGREALKQGGVTATCTWILDFYYLMIADPVVAEIVMKNCLEKEDFMKFATHVPGFGIGTSQVSVWRPRRKFLNPIFNIHNLNKFVELFKNNINIMVEELNNEVDMGPFSIYDYVTRCAVDTACETIFGEYLTKHYSSQRNHRHSLKDALNNCIDIVANRIFSPWLYSEAVFDMTSDSKMLKENINTIINFIGPVITETLKQDKDNPETLLQTMIKNCNSEATIILEHLIDECMVVMVGITKPFPIAFSFIMLILALYPDVQEKVYHEISEVFGDKTKPIDPENLSQLKYTEAVIKETMRLYPPIPVITRKIDKELVLPDGKILVEDVGVIINIWAVHRNKDYWGADAEEFRPERFLKPLPHPAAFLGFSYGIRGCLGFQYATMLLKTSITSMLRQFRVTSANKHMDKQKPIRLQMDIMLRDVDNYRIQLKSR